MQTFNVVIIGTGPAGYTAAIYCARASFKPLVFEGPLPGGQLTTTTVIENFPGYPEGIDGAQLMAQMKEQAHRFGAEFRPHLIEKIDLSTRPFKITPSQGDPIAAHSVIIATGASAKTLGLPHEWELMGRGVSTCATCDGFFYRGKEVHIVGGGDSALEEAMFLTKFATKVSLVHRRDSLRASQIMQTRALENPKIEFVWNSVIESLEFDATGLTGLQVRNLQTQQLSSRKTDGLFYAIGHTPNTQFLGGQLPLDEQGYIRTRSTITEIPGVFACGDVQDHRYRQAITAAGSGCMAALEVEHFLAHNPTV